MRFFTFPPSGLPALGLLTALFFLLCSCSNGKDPEVPDDQPPQPEVSHRQSTGKTAAQTVPFEEPDPPEAMDPAPAISPKTDKSTRPLIAIIIDDMGHHPKIGQQLLDLDLNLTFSFLPFAPFTAPQVSKAYTLGRDILVHIPMEPADATWNPGEGALYLENDPQTLTRKTQQMIEMVPLATGANNHMGSKFTADRKAMTNVLAVLKDKNFFFVDSFTTADSKGLQLAGEMGIPATRRHVFLDNVRNPEKVCDQIVQLVALARKRGWAVGIGHPNQATLAALTLCKKELLSDVTIVGVSQLVNKL